MAEFKEVCRQWRRMCDEIQRCSTEKNELCAMHCALGNNPVCCKLPNATDKDLENAEAVIMEWAKKNPEPVYPAWAEWLQHKVVGVNADSVYEAWHVLCTTRIPADIAEKLGIAPKEG